MFELDFERFPQLYLEGRQLIWDTRQFQNSEQEERVYINPHLSFEFQEQLRTRAQQGECVSGPASLTQLGIDASEALGHPSCKLFIVGVTGTNGKTSCVEALAWMYSSLGFRTLQIGTLGISIWDYDKQKSCGSRLQRVESGFTTPEAPSLHKLFATCCDHKITHVVMEVSSHALELARVAGVDFDAALFTGLSQDHLDFHGSMENYAAAKAKLFTHYLVNSSKKNRQAIMCQPDILSEQFIKAVEKSFDVKDGALKWDTLSLGKLFSISSKGLDGVDFVLNEEKFSSKLIGEHNAWNLALCIKLLLKNSPKSINFFKNNLKNFSGSIGRMERVVANCFVDFAHTPDALEKTLNTLKSVQKDQTKVFAVMGCGGNRDRQKRPQMGRIAAQLADRVFITNDNPRFEDPKKIADEIMSGVAEGDKSKSTLCLDRAQAIQMAIQEMKSDDILLVAGKGHENYQIFSDKKVIFSDQEQIRESWAACKEPRH
jgi:UDP-N-acetylmuramoyl-L-alanyl-D-glutamate--2,6-diaminopimelate ligase